MKAKGPRAHCILPITCIHNVMNILINIYAVFVSRTELNHTNGFAI